MLNYIIRRLFLALIIVVLSVTFLFIIIQLVPGDPARTILGPRATPELIQFLTQKMGLDKPIFQQIGLFFLNLLRGDLGYDYFTQRTVSSIVLGEIRYSLELIFASLLWSASLGTLLGVVSAIRQNTIADKIIAVFSVSFIAIPAFVIALYSLLLFSVSLNWFPSVGVGTDSFSSKLYHLVLPSFAMGLSWVGYISRLVRNSMLEILNEKHIRNARAFGLSERVIIIKYALRLAILPTVTVIGIGMGFFLSATVFMEMIFSRPGIGKLVIDSITTRNYPVVMGTVLFSTIIFVVSTTLSDVINAILDPRLRQTD